MPPLSYPRIGQKVFSSSNMCKLSKRCQDGTSIIFPSLEKCGRLPTNISLITHSHHTTPQQTIQMYSLNPFHSYTSSYLHIQVPPQAILSREIQIPHLSKYQNARFPPRHARTHTVLQVLCDVIIMYKPASSTPKKRIEKNRKITPAFPYNQILCTNIPGVIPKVKEIGMMGGDYVNVPVRYLVWYWACHDDFLCFRSSLNGWLNDSFIAIQQ